MFCGSTVAFALPEEFPNVEAVEHFVESGPAEPAVLGSVARDGSALLLAFASSGAESRLQSLSAGDEAGLVGIARSVGGDLYHTVLRQHAQPSPGRRESAVERNPRDVRRI